jgi:hypothetical protein
MSGLMLDFSANLEAKIQIVCMGEGSIVRRGKREVKSVLAANVMYFLRDRECLLVTRDRG